MSADGTATQPESNDNPSSLCRPVPRVLVADSDPAVTGLLARSLIEEGYEVEVAHDGRDALSLGEESCFDMVLLDHFLPGVLGIEVLQRWVTSSLSGKVLMMSSVSDHSSAVLSLDTGAIDFVAKPFDLSVLLARIRAHLRHLTPATAF